MSLSFQKYGVGIRDPGSGKYLFQIPDPLVKKDSGSATLVYSKEKISIMPDGVYTNIGVLPEKDAAKLSN